MKKFYVLFENYNDGESCLMNTGYATKREANKAAKELRKEYEKNDMLMTVSIHEIEVSNV